jgi:pimeloyl-ACP methyl ester carboxylesterase
MVSHNSLPSLKRGVLSRASSVMVDELHRLLAVAEAPTPHVFVGWSYGGIISELYAARYPHAVAGLVRGLLASSCEILPNTRLARDPHASNRC